MSSVSLPLRMMKRPGMAGRFAALPSSRITIELCASAVWPQIRPSSCALRLPGTDPTSGRWVATSRWMPSARPRRPMARSLFVITEIAALPSLSRPVVSRIIEVSSRITTIRCRSSPVVRTYSSRFAQPAIENSVRRRFSSRTTLSSICSRSASLSA